MPGESPIFDPSPDLAQSTLSLVGSPDHSFHDIARHAGTTPPALAAWLALPTIHAQIEITDNASATHARLAATSNLPAAVAAIVNLLHAYNRGQLSGPPATTSTLSTAVAPTTPIDDAPDSPDNLRARHLRLREHEIARRASYLLYRLARFYPATAPPARLAEPTSPPQVRRRADLSEPCVVPPSAEPPAPVITHAPNPGAVPLGLHPPTSAPAGRGSTPHADAAPNRAATVNDRPTTPPSDRDVALSLESLTAFLENFAAQAGIDTSDLDPGRAPATTPSLALPGPNSRRGEVAESSMSKIRRGGPVRGIQPPSTQSLRNHQQQERTRQSPAHNLIGAAGSTVSTVADTS